MSTSSESSMKEKKIRGILFVIAMPEEGMRVLKTLELEAYYDDLYFSMHQKCFGSVEGSKKKEIWRVFDVFEIWPSDRQNDPQNFEGWKDTVSTFCEFSC